jgi:hypothetical protein
MNPIDQAALTLAVEVTRRESKARRQQIDDFLSERPWEDVATFCASCAQNRSLHCRLGNRRRATSATWLPPSTTPTNSAAIARRHCCGSEWSAAVSVAGIPTRCRRLPRPSSARSEDAM